MSSLKLAAARATHDFVSFSLCSFAFTASWFVVGKDIFAFADSTTLAHAYTTPLTKAISTAETLPNVTGALKKMKPLTAMGSLFRAPTMEYVVDEVTRMHQAEQYEMKIVPRPE